MKALTRRLGTGLLLVVLVVVLASCDWPSARRDAAGTGFNGGESRISAQNVVGLREDWRGHSNGSIFSPVVANGVAFAGSNGGTLLYAFDAAGMASCSGVPKSCAPLWTSVPLSGARVVGTSPAVADGIVYIGGDDHKLYAFDAAGTAGCSGNPKRCAPLWSAATGGVIESSPVVADGRVYVGADDYKLYAFDAAGTAGCSGTPKTCTPLWTATTAGAVGSAAVAGGAVYVGSADAKLYAFDAAGVTGCLGTPKVCAPEWTGATSGPIAVTASPAVAYGVVYLPSTDGGLYAFDAVGTTGCSGVPKVCNPRWKSAGLTGSLPYSPAVANGVVYIGSSNGSLYALDAFGSTGCAGTPTTCTALWAMPTSAPMSSSPAIAKGAVYATTADGKVYAVDATCTVGLLNGNCYPLWTATLDAGTQPSSPIIANGRLYVGSNSGTLRAFALPTGTAVSTSFVTTGTLSGGPPGDWRITETGTVSDPVLGNGTITFSFTAPTEFAVVHTTGTAGIRYDSGKVLAGTFDGSISLSGPFLFTLNISELLAPPASLIFSGTMQNTVTLPTTGTITGIVP